MSSDRQPISNYMPLGEFAKRVFLLGALVIAALALWELRLVLLLTFLAIIIAISLDVPVRKLENYGFRRGVAVLLVTFATVFILALLLISIGAPLVNQTENLIDELPEAIETLREDYNNAARESVFLPEIDFDIAEGDAEMEATSFFSAENLTGGAIFVTSVGSFVVSLAFNLLVVIIVSLYLLADPETYANAFVAMIPKNRQTLILQLLVDLRQALVAWLVTQLISMTIIAVLIWFSLGVIWQVPNGFALGILAGVLTFIPNFGSVIAAIPGLIFTLAERPSYIVPVLLTYIVVQQLEANVITPMIVKRRLQVPAAALLVFQVMAGVLFGFLGLLLAVPIFMVAIVLVRDLYVDYLLNNINTEVQSRKSEDGSTVLRVTSEHHTTQEIPLKQIFDGRGPLDRSLQEVMQSAMRREQEFPVDHTE